MSERIESFLKGQTKHTSEMLDYSLWRKNTRKPWNFAILYQKTLGCWEETSPRNWSKNSFPLGKVTGFLQMIIWRDRPIANDHLSPLSPLSPLPRSRFNLADLPRTIWSCCKNFSLSFLDIGNSYTFFFSVGVDSGSPYQLLYSWICLAVVGWGGVGGGQTAESWRHYTTNQQQICTHMFSYQTPNQVQGKLRT